MPRIFDPWAFHATAAVLDWSAVAKFQGRHSDVPHTAPVLQVRWMVSDTLGIPPTAFTVWRRDGQGPLNPVETQEWAVDGFNAEFLPEPMVTLEVDVTPSDPTRPVVLWGFADYPSASAVNAVASGLGPTTLRIRASGIWAFALWGGSMTAVRGTSVRATLAGAWKPYEQVGLPVDGSWAGTTYSPDLQGLLSGLEPPADAARDRLTRGLAPIGWSDATATGRLVSPWSAVDPARYVVEAQKGILAPALFAPGVASRAQIGLMSGGAVQGPTSRGQTAVGVSSNSVPTLGVLLVAAGNDSAAALALGFGTAYPLSGNDLAAGVAVPDLMVTATYPEGSRGDGVPEEYAVVLPAPTSSHRAPGRPTSIAAQRAGLLMPRNDLDVWRETVRIAFDRVPLSVAMERPTVGVLAAYPSAPGPARVLVEPDPEAGGYHPLILTPRPAPNDGSVALADSSVTDLPLDLSARTLGYAVAVADIYGAWSPWADVPYTSAAPPYPIPQVVSARLDSTYAGSTSCATDLSFDLVLDWQVRSPASVEIRAIVAPIPYAGADLPAGVGPFSVPPGAQDWSFVVPVSNSMLLAPAGVGVQYLTADASATVDPTQPDFPASQRAKDGDARRYRLSVDGHALDFAASSHYVVALWAREITTAQVGLWSDVAASAILAYAGSPVPPVVFFPAPPIVPLGSIPDASNASHVLVHIGGIAGASSTNVWSVSESRLRGADNLDPHPDRHDTLPDRYLALQNAYDHLDPTQRRAIFTRANTFDASVDTADIELPRGSAEIHLFAVTAVNAAGVESAWPVDHNGLQAAVAPTVVRPTVPELSAALDPDGTTMSVTITSRCAVPIATFELYGTRIAGAATAVSSMGAPLQVIVAPPATDPSAPPPGLATTVTVGGIPVAPDWRPMRLRAVAVAAARDDEAGRYGARSDASPAAVLSVPPMTPPDLSALTVGGWGDDDTGVTISFTSAAPLDGHVLSIIAGDFSYSSGLAAVRQTPLTPPSGVLRGTRVAGVVAYEAWFSRASASTVVDVTVVLRDPLGRVSVRNATVQPGLIDPPVVTVVATQVAGGFLLVDFQTNAPPNDGTGPAVLDISASQTRIFFQPGRGIFPPPRTTLSAHFSLPDIRDGVTNPLQPLDIDVVRLGSSYRAAVRLGIPATVTLTVTTPQGLSGSARASFPFIFRRF